MLVTKMPLNFFAAWEFRGCMSPCPFSLRPGVYIRQLRRNPVFNFRLTTSHCNLPNAEITQLQQIRNSLARAVVKDLPA